MDHRFSRHLVGIILIFVVLFVIVVAADLTPSPDHDLATVPDFVTRHAPLVWLHSEDPFRPADLLQHIRHTTPKVDQMPINTDIDTAALDLNNLATLDQVVTQGQVALTSNDNVTTLPSWLAGDVPDDSGKTAHATPCVVVLVRGGESHRQRIDAFYFYFYSYDRGANITQVLEPLNRLIEDTEHGMHFGDHVGDWEHTMVRFHAGKPTGIYYSQHADGAAYDWDDAEITVQNERPIVFSAYGSHANYPSDGHHVHDSVLIDYCDAGKMWDPVLSAYFYRFDPPTSSFTRLFLPGEAPSSAFSASSSNLTSYLYFSGLWGDAKYPDDHPLQKTVPYFGLKRFVSGPLGPKAKQLVRKGLFPDRRGTKSWVQWAVEVFMAWYPCCIRGWRKWVSLAVMMGLMVAFVMVLWRAIKRHRSNRGEGYKRIDTDIPLSDLESRAHVDPVHHRVDQEERDVDFEEQTC